MNHLVNEILSHLSEINLLEIALKNKTPSEIEKLLRPYNKIISLKCNLCDNVVKTDQEYICKICNKNTCENCIEHQYKDTFGFKNILCNNCVNEDGFMTPSEVIRCYNPFY